MAFRSLTVFAYRADDEIREIAKKNSETDITIYSRKNGDLITTFISPTRYPEKISALTDSIYPAHIALIHVSEIGKELGEVLVALSLMKIKHTLLLVDPAVNGAFLEKILKEARIGEYEVTDLTGLPLADKIESLYSPGKEENTTVVVDQFFKVKSVGMVILGFVISGTVRKHQDLKASYSDKDVQVKSIQMQDIEVDEAPAGSRVGLALKNIDLDELDRGVILADSELKYFNESHGELNIHPSIKRNIPDSLEVFVSDCMRYQRGTFTKGTLAVDKKVARVKNEFVLANPNLTPRIIGVFRPSD